METQAKKCFIRNKIVFVYLQTRMDHITLYALQRHGWEMFKIVSRTRDEYTHFSNTLQWISS